MTSSLPPPQGSPVSFDAPVVKRGGRSRAWLAFGIFVVGLVGGVALFAEGNERMESAAARMVRVSAGCRVWVTLQRTGTFHVYIEDRAVEMPAIADCSLRTRLEAIPPASGINPHGSAVIGYSVVTPNDVERTMFEIGKERPYRAGPYRGHLGSRFEGESGEALEVSVVADQSEAAIAIGEDVFAIRRPWRIAAGATMGGGMVLALVLMRRRIRGDASR